MSDLKNVVVLGLGQAGITAVKALSKSLPASHRLVIVQPTEFSFYAVSSLRAHTVPSWESKVAFDVTKLFGPSSRHVLLVGSQVVSLQDGSVEVDQANPDQGFPSTTIPYEYLVIATGAAYAPRCRVPNGVKTLAEIEKVFAGYQVEIADPEVTSILVVGAGSTGIEAAGEFKEMHPNKEVMLANSGSSFLPILKASISTTIEKQLKQLGVKYAFNTKIPSSSLTSGKIPKTTFDLGNGQTFEADYVFIAFGFHPNSGFAPAELLSAKKTFRVRPSLQLQSRDNVFAIGDVNDVDEIKLAYNAIGQGNVAAANVLSLVKGAAPSKVYKPAPPATFLTIGSKNGTGQLMGWGLPSWFVTMMKSGSLRVDNYRNEFKVLTA